MSEKKNNTSSTFNPLGLCIGLGVGLCYCVALGRHTTAKKDHQEDKQ